MFAIHAIIVVVVAVVVVVVVVGHVFKKNIMIYFAQQQFLDKLQHKFFQCCNKN